MAEKNIRARGWCTRLSNYTPKQHMYIVEWCKQECEWWICGEEICPTTGTPHLQMAWYFKDARWRNSLLKTHGKTCSGMEYIKMNGSCESNRTYCSKEGNYLEGGILPSQGKRSDLSKLRDDILSGSKTAKQIREEDPHAYHTYGRTIDKLEDDKLSLIKRTEHTMGVWFYGPSGVGKTYHANKLAEGKSVYTFAKADKGWWDHYEGQEVFIIQDYRGQIDYDQLLEMVDNSDYSVPRRGRCPYPFISKLVIITSPLPPWEVYKKRHTLDGLDQLMRRFTIVHLTERYVDKAHEQSKVELENKLLSMGITQESILLTQKWSGNTIPKPSVPESSGIPLTTSSTVQGPRTSSCVCMQTFCEC